MKKILALVLCFCMLAVPANAASLQFTIGSTQVKTVADDKPLTEVTLETAPFTVDGRTMVPVRVIAENFGASVGWDEATQTVTISTEDTDIQLVLGSTAATVNGESVTLDVAPMEQNGRTLVPLRFVTETFGYNVKYVPLVEQIYITDSPIVFRGTQSYVTFEELMLLYKDAEGSYVPSAASGATEEEIITAKLNLLADAFNYYATYCGIYDYASVYAPVDLLEEIRATYEDNRASASALAAQNGQLDVIVHNLYDTILVAEGFVAYAMEQIADEDIQKAYEKDYICAKHILIPTVNLQNGAALSDEEVADAKKLADDLCAQLGAGADFDALMNEYSQDSGLVANPDGYVFTKGEMVEEFEQGAYALQVGEISEPIQSVFGYHIIKREPLPAPTKEFADAYRNSVFEEALSFISSTYNFELAMDVESLLNML